MKLEVTTNIDLDEIGYQFLEQTNPKQFVNWIFETIDRAGSQEEMINLIKKQLKLYEE